MASSPGSVTASWVVILFSGVKGPISIYGLQRPKKFLPILWGLTSVRVNVVNLLNCIVKAHCTFSASIVLGES
jgi:hypothetical protein